MSERPPIPLEIKREVRQRCGFGCVICGCPIYEYEHMVDWHKTHHHKADELTLLCSQHHTEKTNKKLLPVEKVIAANERPFNLTSGVSSPQSLHYAGDCFKLKLGDSISTFNGLTSGQSFTPFIVDGQPVVSFFNDGGNIFLNIQFSDKDGKIILLVDNSELIFAVGSWDVEWVGQKLTIRERLREVLLELEFSPPNMVSINRGSLHYNGVEIEIGRDYICCLNNGLFDAGNVTNEANFGFTYGVPIPEGFRGYSNSYIPRPVANRNDAIREMKRNIKEMRERKSQIRREDEEKRLKESNIQPLSTIGKLMFGGAPFCYSNIDL